VFGFLSGYIYTLLNYNPRDDQSSRRPSLNTIVIIVIVVGGIYLFMKVALYIYRPLYLTKVVRDIQTKYEKLLMILNKEIEAEAENLQKWVAGDHITMRVYHDESELQARLATANEAKLHEQKNYDKFLRTRERFLDNYEKLAEAIVLYRRYSLCAKIEG
jgi:hypothetical protein